MKRTLIYLLALTGILLAGCNESDDGGHVTPITLYEKLNGNWSLMSLKMTDEVAKANALEPFEQNLSTVFNYPDFMLSLNVDDAMRPTDYQVSGNVPPLFPLSGYWQLSSDFQQTGGTGVKIYLYSDAQKTQKTDELRIISVPGSSGEMEFQLTRMSNGAPFVSYNFKLNTLD